MKSLISNWVSKTKANHLPDWPGVNPYLDDENCLENDYEDEDEVRYDTDSDDDSIIPDDEVPHVVLITKVFFSRKHHNHLLENILLLTQEART